MSDNKLTLGQAIDRLIEALTPLDKPARTTAVQAACAHLGIDLERPVAPVNSALSPALRTGLKVASETHGKTGQPPTDIRTLREQKAPQSAKQMACLVAYYLQDLAPEKERKAAISTADIEKYFKQAGFDLPKKIEQVLIDAKRSGYFETAARGEYRLNAVGYNLAAHKLPTASKSL